jgi:hypothetical protein
MKFDWRHYIAVQLEWTDVLLARCQDSQGQGDQTALLVIARDRLQDVRRLAETLARGGDGVRTC